MFPPGEYLKDELDARGIDYATFAKLMDWSPDYLDRFIRGDERMRISEAERLGRFFNTRTETWLNLERAHRQSSDT